MANFGELIGYLLAIEDDARNEWAGERVRLRHLRDASDPYQLRDEDFIKFFRLSKELARRLTEELRPHIPAAKRVTAVALEIKVLTTLVFCGHGSYQKCIGQNSLLALEQSTVSKVLGEVTDAIVDHLVPVWIVFPQTEQERAAIKQKYLERFNFPGIIGSIDCTHIAIVSPDTEDPIRPAIAYYNRKGYHSLNVQMICDADLRILNCNARFPGSVHDSAIWSLSIVKQYIFEQYTMHHMRDSWLIGDSGYGLQPWLLTPVLNDDENVDNDIGHGEENIQDVPIENPRPDEDWLAEGRRTRRNLIRDHFN